MGGLLNAAAVSAAAIFASRVAAFAEDSKEPLKMTLHSWTGQLALTRLMGEAWKNAGLWEHAGGGTRTVGCESWDMTCGRSRPQAGAGRMWGTNIRLHGAEASGNPPHPANLGGCLGL